MRISRNVPETDGPDHAGDHLWSVELSSSDLAR